MSRQEIQVIVESEWWQVVLSGIIGSVIGGLLTLAGVLLVIRHERRTRQTEFIESTVARLSTASFRLAIMMTDLDQYPDREVDEAALIYNDLTGQLARRAMATEPEFAELAYTAMTGAASAEISALMVHAIMSRWSEGPEDIRSGAYSFHDAELEAQKGLKALFDAKKKRN